MYIVSDANGLLRTLTISRYRQPQQERLAQKISKNCLSKWLQNECLTNGSADTTSTSRSFSHAEVHESALSDN